MISISDSDLVLLNEYAAQARPRWATGSHLRAPKRFQPPFSPGQRPAGRQALGIISPTSRWNSLRSPRPGAGSRSSASPAGYGASKRTRPSPAQKAGDHRRHHVATLADAKSR